MKIKYFFNDQALQLEAAKVLESATIKDTFTVTKDFLIVAYGLKYSIYKLNNPKEGGGKI